MRVDAHHHFWDPDRGDYGWMSGAPEVLVSKYGPPDLLPHLDAAQIDYSVLIQAAPTLAETHYLLSLAEATPKVGAVVGWVDLLDERAADTIESLCGVRWFRGIRPMLQDIEDTAWVLRDDLRAPISRLAECGGVFDALGLVRHLGVLNDLAARHPDLAIVLNHALKPEIADGNFDDWAAGMAKLATHTHVSCKISGLMTVTGDGWTIAQIKPYVAHLVGVFGADRLMFGSDWPVSTLHGEYQDWTAAMAAFLAGLSADDQARIWGLNAQRIYRIDPSGAPLK